MAIVVPNPMKRFTILVVAGIVTFAGVTIKSAPSEANCLATRDFNAVKLLSGCLAPADDMIIRMRILRANMAVAALSCSQKKQYNHFVTRHQNELVRGGQSLRSLFNRLYKGAATRHLNRFVTHLANRASMRSLTVNNYCARMAKVFENANSLPLQGVTDFIRTKPLNSALSDASAVEKRSIASTQEKQSPAVPNN